jgi:peptide/nickel transport system substrate-binding protein
MIMGIDHKRLDSLRRGFGPIPEHVIDEFVGGRLSRRDFIRRCAMAGLAFPVIAGIVSACESSSAPLKSNGSSSSASGKAGATIRAGTYAPKAAPNPLLVWDLGNIHMLNQVAEGLVLYDADLIPRPWLATSWSPNADATVWTFKIRQGIKFNDGTPMTIDDVVYTLQTQSDPKTSANDLSLFAGILDPSGVVKVDEQTLAFHLQAPYGAFPAAVSSANYNLVIVPRGTDYTKWADTFVGTGPFMKTSFDLTSGANFVRNPHYWGQAALPAALEVTFYADEQPMAAALQSGSLDCISDFSVSTSPQLLDGSYNIVRVRGNAHRALSMRNDMPPFTSKYVRQAVALTLDRPAIVSALFRGYGQLGNDSPFAASYPQTDQSIPRRERDLARAKQLLAQGGVPGGFSADLVTEKFQEVAQLAQIIKASAAEIGIDINLTVETVSQYYGQAVFGKSHWLDGQMSLVDYGARPVPDLFLQAPLQSINPQTKQGSWNAAHFNNATYDLLSKQYIATADLPAQRKLAAQIQTLLLDETPVIYPYFVDSLLASQKGVQGVNPLTGLLFFLNNVTKQ